MATSTRVASFNFRLVTDSEQTLLIPPRTYTESVSNVFLRHKTYTHAAAAMKTWTLETSLVKIVKPMEKSMVNPPIHRSL